MDFDEVLMFDPDLYEDNITRHTFPKPDKLDGKGEDK